MGNCVIIVLDYGLAPTGAAFCPGQKLVNIGSWDMRLKSDISDFQRQINDRYLKNYLWMPQELTDDWSKFELAQYCGGST